MPSSEDPGRTKGRLWLRRVTLSLPLLVLALLTLTLAAVERELGSRIDGELEVEREHVGLVRSVHEEAHSAYVAMLERWIRPGSERADRSRDVVRQLERLRATADRAAQLEPINTTETQARAELLVAVAQLSNRIQRALINEDGPAAIAEIREYTAAINDSTSRVLTIDSAAGHDTDVVIIALRRWNRGAEAGLVLLGAGAVVYAYFWWREKRRVQRQYEAAELARREQEQAELVRSRFFAHLSHELRTPLITIQGLTAKLEGQSSQPVARRIRQAADELLHDINNVLDATKLQSGDPQLRLEVVDLDEIVRRSVRRSEGLIGTKDVRLVIEALSDLPAIVGDVVKLHQVVTNLVANAIKFTEKGTVTVRGARVDSNSVRLEVEDTGIGMSEEALGRIWRPFEQADETIVSRFGGTGLGLSIVQSIVMLHGGDVGARSKAGEGTCFWVKLPISRTAAAA